MNEKNNSGVTKKEIKRRNILKTAGAVGGMTVYGTSTTVAKDSQHEYIGDVQFVEVRLTHDGIEEQKYRIEKADKIRTYKINGEKRKLILNRIIPDGTKHLFAKNNTVIRTRDFNPYNRIKLNNKYRNGLPLESGINCRPSKILRLEDEYQFPNVAVVNNGDKDIRVVSNEKEVTIDQNRESIIKFQRKSVEARKIGGQFKEIENHRGMGRKVTRVRGDIDTIDVRPKINVRNYGKLPVYASDGGEPI